MSHVDPSLKNKTIRIGKALLFATRGRPLGLIAQAVAVSSPFVGVGMIAVGVGPALILSGTSLLIAGGIGSLAFWIFRPESFAGPLSLFIKDMKTHYRDPKLAVDKRVLEANERIIAKQESLERKKNNILKAQLQEVKDVAERQLIVKQKLQEINFLADENASKADEFLVITSAISPSKLSSVPLQSRSILSQREERGKVSVMTSHLANPPKHRI